MIGIAQMANPLWQSMCLFSFAFLVFSWVQAHKGRIAVFDSMRYIVFLLALLATIAYSKDLFISGTTLLNDEAENTSTSIEIFLDNAGRTGVEGENDTFAIAAPLTGIILDLSHYLAALIREFFAYFQWGIIFLLYAVSPLMLSFLAHPSTQNIGVRFLTTSFSVMMWKFGFVFADIIFLGAFSEIVTDYAVAANDLELENYPLVAGAAISGLTISMAMWLIAMLFMLIILYILAPLIVYLIFSGASPATALGAAIGSAIAGGMGFSSMIGNLSSSRNNLNKNLTNAAADNSSAVPSSSMGNLPSLSSGLASFPMKGLGAGEVAQREQQRQNQEH